MRHRPREAVNGPGRTGDVGGCGRVTRRSRRSSSRCRRGDLRRAPGRPAPAPRPRRPRLRRDACSPRTATAASSRRPSLHGADARHRDRRRRRRRRRPRPPRCDGSPPTTAARRSTPPRTAATTRAAARPTGRITSASRSPARGVGLVDRRPVRSTRPRHAVVAAGAPRLLPVPGARRRRSPSTPRHRLARRAYRTDPAPALVRTLDVPPPNGARRPWRGPVAVRSDGTSAAGRPQRARTSPSPTVHDAAGNLGRSAPLGPGAPAARALRPRRLPGHARRHGARHRGRGARRAGHGRPGRDARRRHAPAPVPLDAAARRVRPRRGPRPARCRRAGAARPPSPRRAVRPPRPRGRRGRAAGRAPAVARVPVPVQMGAPAARPRRAARDDVAGRDRVDEDGDGEPDLLDRGDAVGLHPVLAGRALPAGFVGTTAPLVAWLDRPTAATT